MRFDIVSVFALAASTVSAGPLSSLLPGMFQSRSLSKRVPSNSDRSAQGSVLQAHNNARSACGVQALKWDNNIASSAQNWANGCRINPLTHSHTSGLGENLASNSNANLFNMVWNQWIGEDKYYSFSNPGFSEATGHFTQAVWASTTHVGCGWRMCGRQLLLVCQYHPAGNIVGNNGAYFRQNVKPMRGLKARGDEIVLDGQPEGSANATSSHQHHRRHQHNIKRHAREQSSKK